MHVSYVMMDLTNQCNFCCKHCYKENNTSLQEIDHIKAINFLRDMDSFGQRVHLILSGGEPLMYRYLFDLLDMICDGRKVQINTNAYYLDKFIDRLELYKNIKLQISLDGYDENSYYHIRNNHHFRTVLNNACLAKNQGLDVFFRTTLTSRTILLYENFIELSEKIGIPLILRPIVNTGLENQKDHAIPFDLLQSWHRECRENGLNCYAGEEIISSHCPLINEDVQFSTLTVDVAGNVYPCMLLKGSRFYMGNILHDTTDEIMRHSVSVREQILDLLSQPKCQACGFRKQFGDGTCAISCFLDREACIREFLQ